MQNSDNCIWKS